MSAYASLEGRVKLLARLAAQLTPSNLNAFPEIMEMPVAGGLANWHHYGCNTFALSESMAAALLLTKPDAAPPPYPAFMLTVPPGFLQSDRSEYQVLTFTEGVMTKTGKPGMQLHVEGASGALLSTFPHHDFTAIEAGFNAVKTTERLEQGDHQVLQKSVRLFAGLCSWLKSHPADGKRNAARSSYLSRYKRDSSVAPRWLEVGKTVRLGRNLIDAAKQLDNPQKRSEWKLSSRHIVRGHYRTVHVGAGRTQTRQVWVQPFWRGPEGEKAWAHIYQMA